MQCFPHGLHKFQHAVYVQLTVNSDRQKQSSRFLRGKRGGRNDAVERDAHFVLIHRVQYIQHILDVVCEHLNVKPEDIKSKKRNEDIVIPRQIVMYLCSEYTDYSSTKIGEFLNKDHSTVLHGVQKLKDDLENDDNLKGKVEIIIKKMNVN